MKKILFLLALSALLPAGAAEIKLEKHEVIPSAWGGAMTKTADGVELKATQLRNMFLGRVRRQLPRELVLWGKGLTYSFRVCGKGRIGVFLYTLTSLYREETSAQTREIALTDDWRDCKVTLRTFRPDILKAYLVVEVKGEGSFMRLADEKLEMPDPEDREIAASPDFVMVPSKGGAAVEFTAPGREQLPAFDGKKRITLQGRDGVFTLNAPADIAPWGKAPKGSVQEGVAKIGVWDEKSGAAKGVYVSRLSDLEWSVFTDIAKAPRLNRKISALVLGDSLSDFCRGFNYIDEISFWINRNKPGNFTFRNAGVAGFTVKQLYAHLAGQHGAAELHRMKGLWNRKYDYVFIFLGHNDTVQYFDKAWNPVPHQQVKVLKEYMPKVIGEIRRHSDAKIVLVTPVAMDYENCKKFAESRKRKGQGYYLFAMPENLVPWCRALGEIAEKHAAACVDLYTPTVALPEKHKVFTPIDGVHLMPRGQHFIAEKLLRFLASQP
ncbi:MAG: hypothetical protein IJU70_04060 [Lentisphaeria bacterium]|nr:hypothetical protein [Lentisphaeria bacterium]